MIDAFQNHQNIGPFDPGSRQVRSEAPGSLPRTRRVIFLALAAGVVATTLLAIVAVATGDFSEGLGKAIGSTTAMFVYCVMAIVGTHRMEKRLSASLANPSVLAAIAGLVTAAIAIWSGESINAIKLAWVGFIVAFATAHASYLQARRRVGDPRVVRLVVTATQWFIAIAAAMLCILVIAIEDIGEGFAQALTIVLLIDVMLNVLVPIIRRVVPAFSPAIPAPPSDYAV